MAKDFRPSCFARVSVYWFGFCKRRKKEPEVSSHISPLSLFGKPTRMSLWKVGCRMRVAFLPFSFKYSLHNRIFVPSLNFLGLPGYLKIMPRPVSGASFLLSCFLLSSLIFGSFESRYSE